MKDELPDLTPYLSKKGGNSQGKGADNPAGKTDISSKLSALVKKTGTFTVPGADAISADQERLNAVESADSATSSPGGSSPTASSTSGTASTSWADVAAANIPPSSSQADASSNKGTASSWDLSALQAKQPWTGSETSQSSGQAAPSWEQVDSFSASTNEAPPAVSNNFDENPSGTFSTSGTFSSRPMRPGGGPQTPSLDMFKAPQAKPMNTLSSGSAPPLLKTPPKDPGRAPAPYTYNANEGPREAVVPKSMQLPTSSQSSSNLAQPKRPTGEQKAPASSPVPEVKRVDPPPSWPAQPTAPQRVTEKAQESKAFKPETNEPKPESGSQLRPEPRPESRQEPRPEPRPEQKAEIKPEFKAPASNVNDSISTPIKETEAEILARAFMEEARALEESGGDSPGYHEDDLLETFSAPVEEPVYDTPPTNLFDDEPPKRSLGFGNLLSSNLTPPEASSEHSTLADLMIPTGEHQALFAPDRQADISQSGLSSFDEVSAAETAPVRMDNQSAPAFSSLFSTEIVTSGQDYGNIGQSQDAPVEQYAEQSEQIEQVNQVDQLNQVDQVADYEAAYAEPFEEAPRVVSKSDVISKLLEAVNQPAVEVASPSSDLTAVDPAYDFNSDSFKSGAYDSDSFSGEEDMRTADTMFGSGGSNKGSAEELSAADAVFGAVPDLVAPSSKADSSASVEAKSDAAASKSDFPVYDPLALPKGELPMAFGDATNFEAVRLEDIKIGKRAAKAKAAEAKAKAEAEAKAKEDKAKLDEQEAKPAAAEPEVKLTLTEMIEQANAAKLEQVQGGSSDKPPVNPKSSLSSLLGGNDDSSDSLNPALSAPVPDADEDEDDDGLGGAISDAFDKLLADGEAERKQGITGPATTDIQQDEDAAFFGVGKVDTPAQGTASGGLGKLLGQSQHQMEPAATASEPAEQKYSQPDEPLTQTQANKVDALSRLLEVASKAPHKSAEEKRNPSDSASKLAAEINKPPGKISRTVDALNPNEHGQGGQAHEQLTSPFGGPSPFTSPFGSPSSSQTRQASQSPAPMANPYSPPSDMPQATISNDAVGARIAALNRKLEEQSRPPSASAMNLEAMQQSPATQTHSQLGVGTGSSPSVNSLSQLPSQVDDSPSTRAELVNRILGSAKISQHGTQLPDLPARNVPEPVSADQVSQIRNGKGGKGQQAAPAKRGRARVSRMPGFDPRPLIAIVILLVVVGGGGFYAYQSGIIKLNLPKPGSEAKLTVDQMIKAGELDRARDVLEGKVKSGKITASEAEKLYSVYYNQADKIHSEDSAEAIKLLEKIPSKSKKYKEAQKLVRKLKKKVKKN